MTDLPVAPGPVVETAAVAAHAAIPQATDWQRLPARGAKLAAFGTALGFALPLAVASGFLSRIVDFSTPWLVAPVAGLLGAAFGAWLGVKRHRRTLWKLDAHGFALQRGRWWQTESRVPISRVQHLDLKRGPLERAFKLATLVIHTAGTKMAAVSVSGLDGEDAERLRDHLAHQLDHADDAL
ncbi:MAG TPA: PH domain-containing protein [Pseudoxanthomonas sp.]|nr:PH domain-containing protein [Pseudoxanthomonas sp.]